jgi:hypothetical protein
VKPGLPQPGRAQAGADAPPLEVPPAEKTDNNFAVFGESHFGQQTEASDEPTNSSN